MKASPLIVASLSLLKRLSLLNRNFPIFCVHILTQTLVEIKKVASRTLPQRCCTSSSPIFSLGRKEPLGLDRNKLTLFSKHCVEVSSVFHALPWNLTAERKLSVCGMHLLVSNSEQQQQPVARLFRQKCGAQICLWGRLPKCCRALLWLLMHPDADPFVPTFLCTWQHTPCVLGHAASKTRRSDRGE